ncbi:hypothetical protein Tco_0624775 [Tanacetum coccineum]|uniref:Uncharacterized protein n=1 Tax=Tanacetum coccineum TaxID=301880 RepID=A0ABQ4WF06_9ASTR
MDFVRFALQELEIHSFMIQIRILSIILQTFSTTLHSPRHTRVSYVGMILTMGLIVHHGYRLSMSRNRATIKTLVIIIHKNDRVFPQQYLCCGKTVGGPHSNFSLSTKEFKTSWSQIFAKSLTLLVLTYTRSTSTRSWRLNHSTHTPSLYDCFQNIYDDNDDDNDDDDDEERTIPLK